jgi:hypothetical protein
MQKSNFEPTIIEPQVETAKSIEQIRKQGVDQQMRDQIEYDIAEMERIKKESRDNLPKYTTLKNDKEQRTFLFAKYDKVEVPAREYPSGNPIPDKMITKYNFYVYDTTNPDEPSELCIYQRGMNEASMILDWLRQGKTELCIKRNGTKGDKKTSYAIWPASR